MSKQRPGKKILHHPPPATEGKCCRIGFPRPRIWEPLSPQESMGLGHCLNNISRNACFLPELLACSPLSGPSWPTSQLLLLPKFKANQRHYNKSWDFQGGPVVKTPSSQAGGLGSIPSWGAKIPQAAEQLNLHSNYWACVFWSPCDTTKELTQERPWELQIGLHIANEEGSTSK